MGKMVLKGVGAAFSALGSIAVVGGLLILIFIDVYKTRAIIRYGKFTTGIVVKFYSDYRGNGSVEYTYEVKGTKYVGTSAVNNFRPNKDICWKAWFCPLSTIYTRRKMLI